MLRRARGQRPLTPIWSQHESQKSRTGTPQHASIAGVSVKVGQPPTHTRFILFRAKALANCVRSTARTFPSAFTLPFDRNLYKSRRAGIHLL